MLVTRDMESRKQSKNLIIKASEMGLDRPGSRDRLQMDLTLKVATGD